MRRCRGIGLSVSILTVFLAPVVAGLYGAGGQIVGAGATARFQIAVPAHWQGCTGYDMQVQGR